MICYQDKTFCSSDVKEHSCGREITEDDIIKAMEMGIPIAYGEFCEEEIKNN